MPSVDYEQIKNIEAEFVVIGGGGSGLAAAVSAAENGVKNIVVVEKRKVLGGNAVMAEGILAIESSLQRRLGFDYSKDDLFRNIMEYTHWKVDARIVRTYINRTADSIQWLEDKGVVIDHLSREFAKQPFMTFHMNSRDRIGSLIIKALTSDCEKMGVRFLKGIATKRLMLDGSKRIAGVVIETKDGEKTIPTKNVVIATGGYAGNSELIKKYWPDFSDEKFEVGGAILHSGDGMMMSTEIGALDDARGALHMGGPDFVGGHRAPSIGALSHEPNTIWVNKKGERFIDEAVDVLPETANALHRQLDGISYSIFDAEIKNAVLKKGTIRAGIPGLFASRGSKLPELDDEIQKSVAEGLVKVSNSWNEIAEWMEISPELLKATIDEYNSFCYQGYDEFFDKERRYLMPLRTPPYYVAKCGGFMGITHGAVKINHRMEVLNSQHDPIPGLYAVGNDAGGWQSDTYSIIFAGSALAFAINSGRIAGENIA